MIPNSLKLGHPELWLWDPMGAYVLQGLRLSQSSPRFPPCGATFAHLSLDYTCIYTCQSPSLDWEFLWDDKGSMPGIQLGFSKYQLNERHPKSIFLKNKNPHSLLSYWFSPAQTPRWPPNLAWLWGPPDEKINTSKRLPVRDSKNRSDSPLKECPLQDGDTWIQATHHWPLPPAVPFQKQDCYL